MAKKLAVEKSTAKPSTNALIVIKSIEKRAAPFIKSIAKIKIAGIKTQADFDAAALYVKQLKELSKEAVVEENKFLVPIKTLMKVTASHFKPFKSEVEQMEFDMKLMMSSYLEKNKTKELSLVQRVKAGTLKSMEKIVDRSNEIQHAASGGMYASVRNVKTLVEVDAKKTPRAFLIPDEQAIKKALLAGEKVEGWKLEVVNSIAI